MHRYFNSARAVETNSAPLLERTTAVCSVNGLIRYDECVKNMHRIHTAYALQTDVTLAVWVCAASVHERTVSGRVRKRWMV